MYKKVDAAYLSCFEEFVPETIDKHLKEIKILAMMTVFAMSFGLGSSTLAMVSEAIITIDTILPKLEKFRKLAKESQENIRKQMENDLDDPHAQRMQMFNPYFV